MKEKCFQISSMECIVTDIPPMYALVRTYSHFRHKFQWPENARSSIVHCKQKRKKKEEMGICGGERSIFLKRTREIISKGSVAVKQSIRREDCPIHLCVFKGGCSNS
jgi:hypothetical protein